MQVTTPSDAVSGNGLLVDCNREGRACSCSRAGELDGCILVGDEPGLVDVCDGALERALSTVQDVQPLIVVVGLRAIKRGGGRRVV